MHRLETEANELCTRNKVYVLTRLINLCNNLPSSIVASPQLFQPSHEQEFVNKICCLDDARDEMLPVIIWTRATTYAVILYKYF